MSRMREINIRPIKTTDVVSLEKWRHAYWEGDLDIPYGYVGDGIETAVAEKNGELLESLVAKKAIVLDPLIFNPDADHASGVAGLYLLERALTYSAQLGGAIESYISVPKTLTAYHEIVKKAGYEQVLDDCFVFRRPLRPHTHVLLRDEGSAADAMDAVAVLPAEEKAKEVECTEESSSCELTHGLS